MILTAGNTDEDANWMTAMTAAEGKMGAEKVFDSVEISKSIRTTIES